MNKGRRFIFDVLCIGENYVLDDFRCSVDLYCSVDDMRSCCFSAMESELVEKGYCIISMKLVDIISL